MSTLTKLTHGMDKGSATSMSTQGHLPSDTVEPRAYGEGLVFMSSSSTMLVRDAGFVSQQGSSFPARKLFREQALNIVPRILQLAFTKKLTVLNQGDQQRVFAGSLNGAFRTVLTGADWLKVEALLNRPTVQNVDYRQSLEAVTRDLRAEIRATFPSLGTPIKPLDLSLGQLEGLTEFFTPTTVPLDTSVSRVESLTSLSGNATLTDLDGIGVPFLVEDDEALLAFNTEKGLTSFDVDFAADLNFSVVQVEKNVDYGQTYSVWGLGDTTSTDNFFLLQYYTDLSNGDFAGRIIARSAAGDTLISDTFVVPDTGPMYTILTVKDGLVNVWFRQTPAIVDFDISGHNFDFDNYSVGILRRSTTIFPNNSDIYANGYSAAALPDSQRVAISEAIEDRYGIASS